MKIVIYLLKIQLYVWVLNYWLKYFGLQLAVPVLIGLVNYSTPHIQLSV